MANTTGKKFGGRQKGTCNKLTKEARKSLKDIVFGELESVEELLEELTPKERIEVLLKLLPYAIPKVQTISHTEGEPLDFDFP